MQKSLSNQSNQTHASHVPQAPPKPIERDITPPPVVPQKTEVSLTSITCQARLIMSQEELRIAKEAADKQAEKDGRDARDRARLAAYFKKRALDLEPKGPFDNSGEAEPPKPKLKLNLAYGIPAKVLAASAAASSSKETQPQSSLTPQSATTAQLAPINSLHGPSNGSNDRTKSTVPSTDKTAEPTDTVMSDDADPLDAFMTDLSSTAPAISAVASKIKGPRGMIVDADDHDVMSAVGDADEAWPMAKKKRAQIPDVDHSKVKYESFRKSFYTEPRELAEMDDDAVKALRFELDGITVQGSNVPKPVQKFAQFGLGAQTLDVVRSLKFEKPSSIQAQAIPTIMSGRDTIGIAKTGSGKTVAYLLPMFRHIKDQRPIEKMDGPISIIIAPTRELATQIHAECKPYLKALDLNAVCVYGGSPLADNIAALKRGVEIVVCTPGRIIELMGSNQGTVLRLSRVTYVVLDEADRMYDMGFEPQVAKVLANVRPDRQMVLFSATFSSKTEALARKSLHKPVQIRVGGGNTVAPEVTQIIEVRSEESKFLRTLELLGSLFSQDSDARALIFVQQTQTADLLLLKIQKATYPCVSVHGNRDQVDRDADMTDFKNGVQPIMIATSVAARGLDVKQLKLVINYDVPNHLEDYVHRAGRTGRAGETGTAVTYITPEQGMYAGDLVKALKKSEQTIPEDLKVLADEYVAAVKAGEKQAASRGYGGRGLERVELQRNAERKQEKRTHGMDDGEGDEEELEAKKKAASAAANILENVQVKARDAPASATAADNTAASEGPGYNFDVVVQRTEKPAKLPPGINPADKAARARAAAAAIASRVGLRGTGRPLDNKGPDAGEFHAIIPVHKLPQEVRWAATSRVNVMKVLEMTSVSITNKGRVYPPGEEPEPGGEPHMYVLIEGDTERQVEDATREIVRFMKEAAAQLAQQNLRGGPTGRYKVL